MSKTTTTRDHQPIVASAYAIVSREEEDVTVPPAVATVVHDDFDDHAAVGEQLPYYNSASASTTTTGITSWDDDFFDQEPGIVAVFDFDYSGMECEYKTRSWCCLGTTAFCFPGVIPWLLLTCVPCHVNKNVEWNVRAQHLAVTRDGVVFCHDNRPTCWGSCRAAKRTVTIPFDQISNIVITEAGNNVTCIGANPLSTVIISTAPSSSNNDDDNFGGGQAAAANTTTTTPPPQLVIVGLLNPSAFRSVVLAMKRANTANNQTNAVAQVAAAMVQQQMGIDPIRSYAAVSTTTTSPLEGGATTTTSNEQLAVLLREIRDELRQSNQAHTQAAAAAVARGATAPVANKIIS